MNIIKKHIANILTSTRIVGALALFFITPLTLPFYIVYTLCGLTDVLDGFAARMTRNESALGAKLDSIADILLYAVMILKLLPVLIARLPARFWIFVAIVFVVRVCSYVLAGIKYRRFASLHTYGNKVTGFVLFLLPYVLGLDSIEIPCYIICAVAGISSAEELAIHATSKEYRPNRKSLFMH